MFYICLVMLVGCAVGRDLTDEEYYRLPDLYHLDNYEKCLAQAEGVYCLGTFHLEPLHQTSPVYDLIQEYTEETYAFNHTLIHRGYCISSRCPEFNSTSHSANFERCAAKMADTLGLGTNLTTLQYCRSRADTQRYQPPDIPQIIFLTVVLFLLVLNVIGTIYHIRTRDENKPIRVLVAWSVIANWKLLNTNEDREPTSLKALHGIRVLVAIFTCLTHSALIYFSLYIDRPLAMERAISHPVSMIVQNSTGSEQMFVVISGFLFALQFRRTSEKKRVTYKQIPLYVAKRIVRLSPVFLIVGFAATWWPLTGSGPIWTSTVGAESDTCRTKFWSHLLFINNLVEPEKLCVLPTWYMAVDMQMHIFSTVLMVVLLRYPRKTLLLLIILFGASCVLNAVLVYIFDWVPLLYLNVSPENLRTLFKDVSSFTHLYIGPWGTLPACLLGLILGHVYHDMKDQKFDIQKYEWLLKMSCLASLPVLATWVLLGYFLQYIKAKGFAVLYATLERSFFQIMVLMTYIVFCVISGFLIKFMAWRGWQAMSRMSLSVMTAHWVVNLYLVGSTPQPMSTSVMDICMYGVTTAVYTFIFAVPITILFEIPIKKFFDIITS